MFIFLQNQILDIVIFLRENFATDNHLACSLQNKRYCVTKKNLTKHCQQR